MVCVPFQEEIEGHVARNVNFFSLGSQSFNYFVSDEGRLQKWGEGWKSKLPKKITITIKC